MQDVDADKSARAAASFEIAWKKFCTPRGCSLDEPLYKHILVQRRVWNSDRCPHIVRTATALRSMVCPNMNFHNKDPCHVMRTCVQPLGIEFKEVEELLFGDKHSIIPSIMNSCELKAKFIAVQDDLLASANDGNHKVMKNAFKHFNFVKPRWESASTPRRRVCYLIVALAVLLALEASDTRHGLPVRAKCLSPLSPRSFC